MISDPVDLTATPLSNVAVSLFLPEKTPLTHRATGGSPDRLHLDGGELRRRCGYEGGLHDEIPGVPKRHHGVIDFDAAARDPNRPAHICDRTQTPHDSTGLISRAK